MSLSYVCERPTINISRLIYKQSLWRYTQFQFDKFKFKWFFDTFSTASLANFWLSSIQNGCAHVIHASLVPPIIPSIFKFEMKFKPKGEEASIVYAPFIFLIFSIRNIKHLKIDDRWSIGIVSYLAQLFIIKIAENNGIAGVCVCMCVVGRGIPKSNIYKIFSLSWWKADLKFKRLNSARTCTTTVLWLHTHKLSFDQPSWWCVVRVR